MTPVRSRHFPFGLTFLAIIVAAFVVSHFLGGGDAAKYGKVDIGTSKVLHLPAGTVDVGYAGHGQTLNGSPQSLYVPPDLALGVAPAASGTSPSVRRQEAQCCERFNDGNFNMKIGEWKVAVPTDGDYRVTAGGTAPPPEGGELIVGSPPQLSLPAIWIVAGAALALLVVAWVLTGRLSRRRTA